MPCPGAKWLSSVEVQNEQKRRSPTLGLESRISLQDAALSPALASFLCTTIDINWTLPCQLCGHH